MRLGRVCAVGLTEKVDILKKEDKTKFFKLKFSFRVFIGPAPKIQIHAGII